MYIYVYETQTARSRTAERAARLVDSPPPQSLPLQKNFIFFYIYTYYYYYLDARAHTTKQQQNVYIYFDVFTQIVIFFNEFSLRARIVCHRTYTHARTAHTHAQLINNNNEFKYQNSNSV